MSRDVVVYILLCLSMFSRSALGQLPPDLSKDFPQHPVAATLIKEVIEQRSKLKLTGDLDSLKSTVDAIDQLVSQTKQAREMEIQKSGAEAPTTKRLNLLVEGFERLSNRVSQIFTLVEKKEHRLAAEAMRFVAAMDRAWTGEYKPDTQPLEQAALKQVELAIDQSRPFLPLQQKIQAELDSKNWAAVSKFFSQLVEDQRSQLGPHHSAVVDTLLNFSDVEYSRNNVDRSIELVKAQRDGLSQLYGDSHWRVRRVEARLQFMEKLLKVSPEQQARVVSAESSLYQLENALKRRTTPERRELLDKALASLKLIDEQVGRDNQAYAKSMHLLAREYNRYQVPSEANFRFEFAEKSMRDAHLDQTPEYATLANEWSIVCKALGDEERALSLVINAINVIRILYGEEHQEYIAYLENFGGYFFQGHAYPKALFVYEKVAKLRFAVFGPTDERYLSVREKLADSLMHLKRFEEAELVLNELSTIRHPQPGSETIVDIRLAKLAADVATHKGERDVAIRHRERSVELEGRIHGKNNERYSIALANLATTLMGSGNDPRVGTLLIESLKIDREHFEKVGYAQTERQHFRLLDEIRSSLSLYLTYAINVGNLDREAYEQILAWKGRSYREIWSSNAARQKSSTPQLRESYTQLCRVLSNLATAVDQQGEKVPTQAQFMKIVEDKENLWRTLARTKVKTDDVVNATLDQIQQALPKQVALVDYWYYQHLTNPDAPDHIFEDRIVAVVVRADQPVKLVAVGSAKVAERGIMDWRKELQTGRVKPNPKVPKEALQNRLRAQLWQPIEEHLLGIETVLISPDGFLDMLPWDALPSKNPGKYLIEDYALHKLSVAQFIVRTQPASSDPVSMLLLGNPTYDIKVKGMEGKLNGMHFGPLPGTAKEVSLIAKLYESQKSAGNFSPLQLLDERRATEATVRELAAKSRFLHLATHGFYRPEVWNSQKAGPLQTEARRQLSVFTPEVLSGIALTAANNGPIRKSDAPDNTVADDGLLTALEVTSLDLRNVDLVVLSACDTSVGAIKANESTLGLQQSFQIAGARATISSLWPVDDASTQALMVEFYRNLWEEKRGRGDALRQAQLAMLNRYDPTKHVLRPRGLKLTQQQQASEEEQTRLQPRYWACFTLSGDWR